RILAAGLLACLGAWASWSCAPGGLEGQALVNSVRILASSADTPYAKPGAPVNIEVLAVDGRTDAATPMTLYWLPIICEDPADDAYFACFQGLAGQGDGGAAATRSADGGAFSGGGAALLKPGVDLTPLLPQGPTFSFTMPEDIITRHAM